MCRGADKKRKHVPCSLLFPCAMGVEERIPFGCAKRSAFGQHNP